jgi:hypothetical protein
VNSGLGYRLAKPKRLLTAAAFTVSGLLATTVSAIPTTAAPTPVDRDSWIDHRAIFTYFERRKFDGVVAYRIDVTAEGRAQNCTVTASSGQPKLNALTCSFLLDRAHFLPARDTNGQPIASTYESQISYQPPPDVSVAMPLPTAFQQKHESGTVDMRLHYRDGRTDDCAVTTSSGFHELDDYSCTYILSQNLPPPPHWSPKSFVLEIRWGDMQSAHP